MTIQEFLAVVEDKSPPAPRELLEALEADLGQRLPEDYRQFLIQCNGGYVGGECWFKGPTPEGRYADAGIDSIGGFREDDEFSLQEARECYQGDELRIPRALMWIMDDPFGNAICLGVAGKYRGRVYFWDHEDEPDSDEWDGEVETAGNVSLLANSFTEFVTGLSPSEDE